MPVASTRSMPLVTSVDVRLRERRQVVVGEDDPLAADAVLRRQLRPQSRVRHLLAQLALGDRLEHGEQPALDDQADVEDLRAVVDEVPRGTLDLRPALEQGAAPGRDLLVGPWDDPARRALVDVEVRGGALDVRDELHRGSARADDRDALAVQRVGVVPLGGVEHRPPEVLEAGDLGSRRLAQRPHRGDDRLGDDGTLRGLHPPALVRIDPGRRPHLGVEDDPLLHAVLARGAVQVLEDLRLGRVVARPLRVHREGERVQVRGDVARAARVRVRPPRAAEPARALEDDEVVDALLAQPDGGAEAAEAGADDRHAHLAGHGVKAAARP